MKKNKNNNSWHDSFSGRIIIAVISGVILIFIGFWIKTHILTEPQPQHAQPQTSQLKQSVQNQTSRSLPSKNKKENVLPKETKTPVPENKQASQPTISATGSNVAVGPISGNVTQTINEFPEPKLDFKVLSENVPENNLFKTEVLLTIDSKTALKNIYLEVRAPSLVSFEAMAQRGGVVFGGHAGKRPGMAFDNLVSPWGKYILVLFSSKPEKYEIIYNYE